MKLIKYILFIIILIASVVFIMKLNTENIMDGLPTKIKIPFLTDSLGYTEGLLAWQAIILTLSVGVFIGFMIALIQIISQKAEIISLKSNLRKSNDELDILRNQTLDDDIDLIDENESDDL
tara:strand:- start:802 stop:1164 length:363 start_codon:yes stop_codon:yes gene_type:complete